jgi:hypothetical protein
LRPVDGAVRRRPPRQFVERSLFNLEEKSSCRFSADAGGRIAPCNSWLMVQKPRADRQRCGRNWPTARRGDVRERPGQASVRRHSRQTSPGRRCAVAGDAVLERPLIGRLALKLN